MSVVNTKQLQINLPDYQSVLTPFLPLTFKLYTVKYDTGLMRALCIHNLSGKVSFDNMMSFGTGYAKRKFIAHERVIYNPSITNE